MAMIDTFGGATTCCCPVTPCSAARARSDAFKPSLDGITLLQEHVTSPGSYITRVEFIGGKYFCAVRVETEGSFELCPADPCAAVTLRMQALGSRDSRSSIRWTRT